MKVRQAKEVLTNPIARSEYDLIMNDGIEYLADESGYSNEADYEEFYYQNNQSSRKSEKWWENKVIKIEILNISYPQH